jgi:nucleoside-diphosphate-sugar epimerase
VALLGWLYLLLTVEGVRLAKSLLLHLYKVEPKKRARQVKRVLVLGGAGYLGSHLVPRLLRRGYQVRVLDLFLFGEDSLAPVKDNPGCELMKGDVRDIEATVRAMQDCDAVVDLAAIVGDPACEENRSLAVEVNRAATRMLLDIARGYGVQRFLFASTCSVYGAADVTMDEMSRVVPLSTYAHTKIDSESILLDAASETFHPTVFRLGTLFGLSPRMRFDLVVNLLTVRAARIGKITIFNGHQWRPFLHVEDAARAFIECLEASPESVSGEIFNVGGDALNHQLNNIGEALIAMLPNVAIERIENADARNYRVSFEKVRVRLGFKPRRLLRDGIQEMYDAIATGKVEDYATAQFNNLAAVKAFSAAVGADSSPLRRLVALAGEDR